jgi:prephenate dehydratase
VASGAKRYSYLGPVGTFTWEALGQVSAAAGQEWVSVHNVGEALDDVLSGRSDFAMIAIENSIEGGVSATQDALAMAPELRIVGEYMVPVRFVLAVKPGQALSDVTTVAAHAVAYAQCRGWLEAIFPSTLTFPLAPMFTQPRRLWTTVWQMPPSHPQELPSTRR